MKKYSAFLMEGLLFSAILGLGIANAFRLSRVFEVEKIETVSISFWQFVFYFLFATFFILAVTFLGKKLKREKGIVFKFIFILAAIWGGLITLSLWLPDILALILAAFLVLAWIKKPTVLLHNLVMALALAGIGGVLGLSIPPSVVIFLLIAFSVYDIISVYVTKHMVKMAKAMMESGSILGLIVPQNFADFKAGLKDVKPGGRFLVLGGGDVVFPLILCSALIPFGLLNSLIVALFALAGLFASFYFFVNQKEQRPIPALPPIALFSIMGYLVTLAI